MVLKLGDRMKTYEREYEMYIPYDKYIIIRIDGHKFSKFTRGMIKPFCDTLSKAMEETTKGLCKEFNAISGYTQSDEITLILPPKYQTVDCEIQNNQIYRGRIQKLASLSAAKATQEFNKHFKDLIQPEITLEIYKSKLDITWFDSRVFGVDTQEEAYNCLMWRARDNEKNSRSIFARAYCSHKQLHRKTSVEQTEYCKEKTGHDWNNIDPRYKYGILVRKEKYLRRMNNNEEVVRTRFVSLFVQLTSFSKENMDIVFSNRN